MYPRSHQMHPFDLHYLFFKGQQPNIGFNVSPPYSGGYSAGYQPYQPNFGGGSSAHYSSQPYPVLFFFNLEKVKVKFLKLHFEIILKGNLSLK